MLMLLSKCMLRVIIYMHVISVHMSVICISVNMSCHSHYTTQITCENDTYFKVMYKHVITLNLAKCIIYIIN